jgi:hypothetical protein
MSPDVPPPSSSEPPAKANSSAEDDDFETSSWCELPEAWQQATDYALITVWPPANSGMSSNSVGKSSLRGSHSSKGSGATEGAQAPSAYAEDPLEWLVQDLLDQFPGMTREELIQTLNGL